MRTGRAIARRRSPHPLSCGVATLGAPLITRVLSSGTPQRIQGNRLPERGIGAKVSLRPGPYPPGREIQDSCPYPHHG